MGHQDYRSILIVTDNTHQKQSDTENLLDLLPRAPWCCGGTKLQTRGEAAISDHRNLLDPQSVINLATSALDENPLPSSSMRQRLWCS